MIWSRAVCAWRWSQADRSRRARGVWGCTRRRANEILEAASVFFATELNTDRPKRWRSSTRSASASGSSRSAGFRACRRLRPNGVKADERSARSVR